MTNHKTKKLTVLAIMIALDVFLTPIFRIEGMAFMSSVVNIIAGVIMGPIYALVMALLSAPIMVWFWTWTADGNHEVLAKASAAQSIFLFMPRFIGATIIGGVIALLLLQGLKRVPVFMTIQALFKGEKVK